MSVQPPNAKRAAMPDTPADPPADPLGDLKLWSVLVTILGDLTPAPGDAISGPWLTALIEGLGLQPQAMRVALHRLRKDGWVDSWREGRMGLYHLTEHGRLQTEQVRERVFGPAPSTDPNPNWHVALFAPGVATPDPPSPQILALEGVWILPTTMADLPAEALLLNPVGGAVPDWLRATLDRSAHVQAFAALERALSVLPPVQPERPSAPPSSPAPSSATQSLTYSPAYSPAQTQGQSLAQSLAQSPAQTLSRRMLVLHAWRRLVLRSHPLAEAILGRDASPARCRAQVLRLLDGLPKPAAATLRGPI